MAEAGRVWILDTSALVDFKTLIAVAEQWEAFKRLEGIVQSGEIAMPRQVLNEASELAHPDLPGAWAPGMRGQLRHPLDASIWMPWRYAQRFFHSFVSGGWPGATLPGRWPTLTSAWRGRSAAEAARTS